MRNFQDSFETRKQSFISGFSICMTVDLRVAAQKNVELIFDKLHFIRKLKFRIFNSMAVIFYLSFHVLPYFRVIHNL